MRRNTNILYLHMQEVLGCTKTFVVLVLVSGILFFSGLDTLRAATIYFSPTSSSPKVNSIFSVNIIAGSTDQAMNAASGIVSFPPDKLEVVSLSRSNSVFNLWVQEPSFSNTAGTINFEGIILNPGFLGSAGTVFTATFRTKRAGIAVLTLSSGSVLANDGLGTDILSTLGNAKISIQSNATATPQPQEQDSSSLDESGPKITSTTHQNTNKWYTNSNPEFSWSVPSNVTAVQTLVGSRPKSKPIVLYKPPISLKLIEDMPDGVWYFHLRFRDASGWGETAHFKFNIDTKKPESFEIREVQRKDYTNPRVKFIFDAEDETSGIDHYEVNIDGKDQGIWEDDGSYTYVTNILEPGSHTLIAKAIDGAGNGRSNSIEFVIEPLSAPIIEEYPRELETGETLIVSGDAIYKNVQVSILLQRGKDEPKIYETLSGDDGLFTFTLEEKLKSGTYTLWATVTDDRGAKSDASEKVSIKITKASLLTIGSLAISVLAVIVPLIVLTIFLIFLLWYGWHKFSTFRDRMRRKIRHTESTIHKAFQLLRDDIKEHVKVLKKAKTIRLLTKDEHKMMERLEKSLDEAELILQKEVENIEKEVRSSSKKEHT